MAVPYVDLVLAGSFLAAFAFLLRGLQSLGLVQGGSAPQRQTRLVVVYLTLTGVAAGVGVGSKESGLAYLGVLALVAVGALVAAWTRGLVRPAPALRLVAAFVVPVLLLGTFWYTRNLIEHENPLYPWNVEVAGVVLLRGPQGDPNESVIVAREPGAGVHRGATPRWSSWRDRGPTSRSAGTTTTFASVGRDSCGSWLRCRHSRCSPSGASGGAETSSSCSSCRSR